MVVVAACGGGVVNIVVVASSELLKLCGVGGGYDSNDGCEEVEARHGVSDALHYNILIVIARELPLKVCIGESSIDLYVATPAILNRRRIFEQ